MVIIPNYNHAQYLNYIIVFVLNQSISNFEHLLEKSLSTLDSYLN